MQNFLPDRKKVLSERFHTYFHISTVMGPDSYFLDDNSVSLQHSKGQPYIGQVSLEPINISN